MTTRNLYLIVSMGGTASTNLIAWVAQRTLTNCPRNSEGLPAPGPGSNPKGLKHRVAPPAPDDSYLPEGTRIHRALFVWDSPYHVVPSLFRRSIAEGHAIAITGRAPTHNNDLDEFLSLRHDSFGFHGQFYNWTNLPARYPRLIVRFSALWDRVGEILTFLDLDEAHAEQFPPDNRSQRDSSFERLGRSQQEGLMAIYAGLDAAMQSYPDIKYIPASS